MVVKSAAKTEEQVMLLQTISSLNSFVSLLLVELWSSDFWPKEYIVG